MTAIENIRESLLKIDQFGVPLTLRIGNKNIFNTQMGAFMTMFLTFVLVKSGYSLVYDLMTRGSPQVIVNQQYMM